MDPRAVPPSSALDAEHEARTSTQSAGGANERDVEDDAYDTLAEDFFARRAPDSLAPVERVGTVGVMETEDEPLARPLSDESRRAMRATFAMLGASAVALLSYLAYVHLVLPAPVALGGTFEATLPVPLLAHEATSEPPSTVVIAAAAASVAVEADKEPEPVDTPILEALTKTHANAATTKLASLKPQQDEGSARATRARPPAKTASRRAPSDVDAWIKRAYRELNSGRARDALPYAERALARDATRADAWIALGSAHTALRDHSGAAHAFRSCVQRGRGPYLAQCRALAARL